MALGRCAGGDAGAAVAGAGGGLLGAGGRQSPARDRASAERRLHLFPADPRRRTVRGAAREAGPRSAPRPVPGAVRLERAADRGQRRADTAPRASGRIVRRHRRTHRIAGQAQRRGAGAALPDAGRHPPARRRRSGRYGGIDAAGRPVAVRRAGAGHSAGAGLRADRGAARGAAGRRGAPPDRADHGGRPVRTAARRARPDSFGLLCADINQMLDGSNCWSATCAASATISRISCGHR